MADARRDEERGLASAQLEAFHQTFNFCMDCRQYTCSDCWNQAEGRCQTCAPLPDQVDVVAGVNGADAAMAWPTSDLTSEEAAEAAAAAAAAAAVASDVTTGTPYMPTDLRPFELPDDEVEMIVGTADAAAVVAASDEDAEAAEIAAVAEVETTDIAASADVETTERGAFLRAVAAAALVTDKTPHVPAAPAEEPVAPQPVAATADEAVAAELVAAESVAEEPAAAELVAAEAVAEEAAPRDDIKVVVEAAALASVAAAVDTPAEAEPVTAAEPLVAAEPALEPEPEPVAPATLTPTPGWTIVAPDVPDTEAPSGPPAWPPRAPVYQPPAPGPAAPPPTPGAPGQPSWPTVPPAAFSVPAAQAVWEESSLEVTSRPGSGVQACVSCGLPLSAAARFCRRCGSRQG
jgi:hypothetical protein